MNDRNLYKENLSQAHADTSLEVLGLEVLGLEVLGCDYFMSINLSAVNSESFSPNFYGHYVRRMLSASSKMCWSLEKYGLKLPHNRLTSSYIIAIAQKSLN